MAIAAALPGFNDLGRSVTPTFLFRNIFYSQLSPHCPKMNKKPMWEVKKNSRFLSTGHRILPSCGSKAHETMVTVTVTATVTVTFKRNLFRVRRSDSDCLIWMEEIRSKRDLPWCLQSARLMRSRIAKLQTNFVVICLCLIRAWKLEICR